MLAVQAMERKIEDLVTRQNKGGALFQNRAKGQLRTMLAIHHHHAVRSGRSTTTTGCSRVNKRERELGEGEFTWLEGDDLCT